MGAASGIWRWDDPQAHASLSGWLRDGYTIVLHNGPFDIAVLATAHPDLLTPFLQALEDGRIRDTWTRDKLLGIAYGQFRWRRNADGTSTRINYGLADVAYRHLGEVIDKKDTWRKYYEGLRNVPLFVDGPPVTVLHPDGNSRPLTRWPHEALHYAIKDAVTTYRSCDSQEQVRARVLASNGIDLLADEARQNRAAMWLHLTGCWGMLIDPAKRDALADAIQRELDVCKAILLDAGLLRAECYKRANRAKGIEAGQLKKYTRNTKAASAYMVEVCEDNGITVRRTKKAIEALAAGAEYDGGIALDEESCKETGDHVLTAYADYTSLANVLGKDIKHMQAGEIHGSFDPLVDSGRSSCRGFNLQNLRQKGGTRECFAPRPGFVYCIIDLETAELRGVAQLCLKMFGRSRLAQVINPSAEYPHGRDVHLWLTASAMGLDYEHVAALYAADDPTIKAERQLYKSANFGLWGGMREKRFANLVRSGMRRAIYECNDKDPVKREADRNAIRARLAQVTDGRIYMIRRAWLQTWPEAQWYLDHFERLCSNGRETTLEQFMSGRWRGGMRYSQACNTGFQGLVADAAKAAGWRVSRMMYDATQGNILYGSRVVNFPHDELVCEVPEAIGHECAQEIQRIVLAEVGVWLPDVPPVAKPALSRIWSKDVKPIVGPDGRLLPYEGKAMARAA